MGVIGYVTKCKSKDNENTQYKTERKVLFFDNFIHESKGLYIGTILTDKKKKKKGTIRPLP